MGPDGEFSFNREFAEQLILGPDSGLYWQGSARGHEDFPSRSLWDRRLTFSPDHHDVEIHAYDSAQFPSERLRILERDVKLPGSTTWWRFQVAESRATLDAEIAVLRRTLVRSFLLLALGLIVMAALQTFYGLRPLRKVRLEIAKMRAGKLQRVEGPTPTEVVPMVEEGSEGRRGGKECG